MEILFAILAILVFSVVAYFIIKDVLLKPTIREMKTRINQHQEAIEYYQQQIKKIEHERCNNQYHGIAERPVRCESEHWRFRIRTQGIRKAENEIRETRTFCSVLCRNES